MPLLTSLTEVEADMWFMLAWLSLSFEPPTWISLWGMTSLSTKRTTVPAFSVTESVALGLPLPSCHMWQPRIWWLIVIVAVPAADAADVATSPTRAASRSVPFTDMVPPLNVPLSVGAARRDAIRGATQSACGFSATPLRLRADAVEAPTPDAASMSRTGY